MEYRGVEIDLEVFRLLESHRTSFEQTHNDLIRVMVGLPALQAMTATGRPKTSWYSDGVTLPHGTKLRMTYNHKVCTGEIQNGEWHVGGEAHKSPSGAAGAVARSKYGTRVQIDGWNYWAVQLPGEENWKRLRSLRRDAILHKAAAKKAKAAETHQPAPPA